MIAVLCAAIFVMSVCAAVFFDTSLLFSGTAALVSAALFTVEVFLFKGSRLKSVLVFLAAAAGLCVCIYAPNRATDYGLLDHIEMYSEYVDAAADEKKEKSTKALDALIEKYGEDDNSRYIKICQLAASGDIGSAEEVVSHFSNKASPFYLSAQEIIMTQKYESAETLGEHLIDLYIQSSDDNPDWGYPAKHAGGLLFDRGKYDKAAYYLTRAMLYGTEDDPEVYYYLGAALCEQDNYEKGLPLLNKAYELGADDALLGGIAYYVERSGMGEKTDEKSE
ncbi:MAG: hypothetical protein IKQ91_00890 [Oscillospiraceae bacterium]|nr:hypothetical protein [Oscillospiraceae bacterium]